jgi:hypothetical protein
VRVVAADSFTAVHGEQCAPPPEAGPLSQAAGNRPEPLSALNHFSYRQLWRNVMRWFFLAVGVLAWLLALGVVWIFSESGGALTFIAAGVFATVAILALVGERIIKTLEEIRDGSVTRIRVNAPAERAVTERVVTEREVEPLATTR